MVIRQNPSWGVHKCAHVCPWLLHSLPCVQIEAVAMVDARSDTQIHTLSSGCLFSYLPCLRHSCGGSWGQQWSLASWLIPAIISEAPNSIMIKQLHKCTWKAKFQSKCAEWSHIGEIYNIWKYSRIHSSESRNVQSLRMLLWELIFLFTHILYFILFSLVYSPEYIKIVNIIAQLLNHGYTIFLRVQCSL